MLRILWLLLILGFATAVPFLCRKPGEAPEQIGSCGSERTALYHGSCLCCYNNTADIPTIGIGFNLLRYDAREKLDAYNLHLEDVLDDCRDRTTKSCLTSEDAIDLYDTVTYPELQKSADDYIPGLPQLVKAAIADIIMSDGEKLEEEGNFPRLRGFLEAKKYTDAANALRQTRWCRSVPKKRCDSNVQCLATHCSKGEYCNNYKTLCSIESSCFCQQTDEGYNICTPNYGCPTYPDCSNCSTKTSVCVKKNCCTESCIPLKVLDQCPLFDVRMKLNPLLKYKKRTCLHSNDCPNGKSCQIHANGGQYCV